MALITWSDSMSVGVSRADKEALAAVLDKLVAYTKVHFAGEEALFRALNYPAMMTHLKEHAALTQKAIQLQSDFKAGKAMISAPVLDFLRDWLINHILKQDMAYKPFFASKGVR